MAEHLNQNVEPTPDAMNFIGKPLGSAARHAGYEHCRAMGLDSAKAMLAVQATAEKLERDAPYEAQAAAMKYLDLTGAYRLFAALLCAEAEEAAKRALAASEAS